MLPCCMSLEKQLNIHKSQIIVFVHLLAQLKQSFCAKLVLPGPLSMGSLIFQLREDVMDTTFLRRLPLQAKNVSQICSTSKPLTQKFLIFLVECFDFFFPKENKSYNVSAQHDRNTCFQLSFMENQSICNGKNCCYQISQVAMRNELQWNCRIMQSEEGLASMLS